MNVKRWIIPFAITGVLLGGNTFVNAQDNYYYTQGNSVETVKANEVLQAGTVIPATLVTRMTSDSMDSVVIAVVRQNIYDSVSGKNILIPAGSRLIGEPYSFEKSRLNLSFSRIIFPNGHSVQLPDYKAMDSLGQTGLKDKYTRHTWIKVRSVLTGAILAGATTMSTKNTSRTTTYNNGNSTTYTESAGDAAVKGAVAELISGITNLAKQDQDVVPTGTIREGYQFNVVLDTDIQIRPYTK